MTEPQAGFSIGNMFSDPNFLQLLAGIGAAADPEGAGGVIGKPTMNLIKSKAAQSAAAKQLESGAAERDELRQQHRELLNRLGPITGPSEAGLNSIKPAANRTVNIDLNAPDTGKLVSDLGGFSALEEPGINSMTRSPSGSTLVNYTLPKRREIPIVADEIESLDAAPTAIRDRSRLSYTPTTAATTQADIDSTLSGFLPRRSL
jgi:hypothetical protein